MLNSFKHSRWSSALRTLKVLSVTLSGHTPSESFPSEPHVEGEGEVAIMSESCFPSSRNRCQSSEGRFGSAAMDSQVNVWFANYQSAYFVRRQPLEDRLRI